MKSVAFERGLAQASRVQLVAIMEPRPDVIVDFVFEDGMLYFGVQNISPVPAVKVHVAFDPPFRGLGGNASIPELPLFRNIEFLAPSRSIRTLLDSSAAYFARKEPEHITATVSYSDRSGEKFSSTMRQTRLVSIPPPGVGEELYPHFGN